MSDEQQREQRERRAAVSAAFLAMGQKNRVQVTPGMTRQELNAALHRAGAGEMPASRVEPTEPERAAGSSLDGGTGGAAPTDPRDAVNRAFREAMSRPKGEL